LDSYFAIDFSQLFEALSPSKSRIQRIATALQHRHFASLFEALLILSTTHALFTLYPFSLSFRLLHSPSDSLSFHSFSFDCSMLLAALEMLISLCCLVFRFALFFPLLLKLLVPLSFAFDNPFASDL
jgi:hypothetical protein